MVNAIPKAIAEEVVRQQEKMGWPDYVPRYWSLPDPGDQRMKIWGPFENLTVADCEQLVEHHSRFARENLQRFENNGGKSGTCRAAAHHILYARLYRCQYFTLMGMEDTSEADMPFPFE